MEYAYQIVVGNVGKVHEGDDLNQVSAVFYARMLAEQATILPKPMILLEHGKVVTVFEGKDYARC